MKNEAKISLSLFLAGLIITLIILTSTSFLWIWGTIIIVLAILIKLKANNITFNNWLKK